MSMPRSSGVDAPLARFTIETVPLPPTFGVMRIAVTLRRQFGPADVRAGREDQACIRAVGIGDVQRCLGAGDLATVEQEAPPIVGEVRATVDGRAGDERHCLARCGIDCDDVAVGGSDDDYAVARRSERRRHRALRTDIDECRGRDDGSTAPPR